MCQRAGALRYKAYLNKFKYASSPRCECGEMGTATLHSLATLAHHSPNHGPKGWLLNTLTRPILFTNLKNTNYCFLNLLNLTN